MIILKKRKKIIGVILAVVIIGLWAVRYYTLNDGFAIKYDMPHEYFDLGEKVEFDDDRPSSKVSCKGYSVRVNGVKFYEPDEYIKMYSKEDVSLKNYPDKVAELDVTFFNSDNTTDGLQFYPMQLLGKDWFMTMDPELIALANPIFENDYTKAYGIILRPDSSYDVKLVYGLHDYLFPEDRWNNIENENMWLEITIMPTDKFIKLFDDSGTTDK